MMQLAGLLLAGMVMGALIRRTVKVAGRWYAWKRATAQARHIVAGAHRKYGSAPIFAMAGAAKHGAHVIPMDLPALGAGAAADTSTLFTYHGEGASILGTLDRSLETVKSAVLTFDSTVTGAATNNFAVQVSHYNSLGSLKNQIVFTFGNGQNATAFVPIDISGPVAGSLTNPTGKTIQYDNWTLFPGDSIVVKRVSNGTGLASGAFTVTIKVASIGS